MRVKHDCEPHSLLLGAAAMRSPPESIRMNSPLVACDGAGEIAAALDHPRVFIQIDEAGYADCGYCDRRFVLAGSAADGADQSRRADRERDGAGR